MEATEEEEKTLQDAVNGLDKAVDSISEATELNMKALKLSVNKETRIILDNVEQDGKNAIAMLRNGGNIEDIKKSLMKSYSKYAS